MAYRLCLIAGEASGDALGANLIKALRARPDFQFSVSGLGGPMMAEEGIKSAFDISELSIIGFTDALLAAPRVKRRIDQTVAQILADKPDAVILIDSYGFTVRVAQAVRKADASIKLIKYVAPQVWATRPKRAKTLSGCVDLLLGLHEIDRPFFEAEGLKTVIVGNPAVHVDLSGSDPLVFRKQNNIKENQQIVLVLPGSRPSEIKRLMPTFKDTIRAVAKEKPETVFVLPISESVKTAVESALEGFDIEIVRVYAAEAKYAAMKSATVALACSGTVTTELALCGCPMVVAYRLEAITWWLYKATTQIKYVTMINLLAGREIAPEFIQEPCTSQNLSQAILSRLGDPELCAQQANDQFKALKLMGHGQPSTHQLAAEAIEVFLK